MPETHLSRRTVLTLLAATSVGGRVAAGAGAESHEFDSAIVESHDQSVDGLLERQVTDRNSRWRGAYPDRDGLHNPGSAGHILEAFAAAFLNPQSQFHNSPVLFERMRLASGYLERAQSPQGNIDLLVTNFNSPPDTGFVIHRVGTAAHLAVLYDEPELAAIMEPFIRKAGAGMAEGGIHTPNHRWVVCAALAQIHELFPDSSYTRRIDQWLAEGIDIDEDGQFTERSTTVYNAVTDRALVTVAHKLKRPQLLDPVRKNLDSMLYLLHPNGEVVTEISNRQDVNTRGTMAGYWFPLRYLAAMDGNGRYATLVRQLEPGHIRLSKLMEYPELREPLPENAPIPENYEKTFSACGVTRIRRGATSATLIHRGNSRFLSFRHGEAVVNAVRFASAFFGKGQFKPDWGEKRGDAYHFGQAMQAPYYQPLDPPRRLAPGSESWSMSRHNRERTEIANLEYSVRVTEMDAGFAIHIRATGTGNVPLTVEVNLREGGQLEGCTPVPGAQDAFLLTSERATYRMGRDEIRFGPGLSENTYTQVRGAQPKLPGPSVYMTSYTPLDHTLVFDWA